MEEDVVVIIEDIEVPVFLAGEEIFAALEDPYIFSHEHIPDIVVGPSEII